MQPFATKAHPSGLFVFLQHALSITLLLFSGTLWAQTISDDCAVCHNQIYQDWKASGHPYKLMESAAAQNRPIPLPDGYAWDDISYVIGGYRWKSRYMDNDGYIITQGITSEKPEAGNTQYNYLVGDWSDYHADEADGTKPYNCGKCHTTGWVPDEDADTDNDLSDNQGGLPGIHGSFEAGGIQCIQCHGGAMHADMGDIDRSADACGACHYRTAAPGEENVITAKGGWIKHHEQYNEHLAGPHAAADCVVCHNPHKRGEFSTWQPGDEGHEDGAVCGVSCHESKMESFMQNAMYDYGVTCQDCHMPFASKSAIPLGAHQGDVKTHIFYINTDPLDKSAMFSEDGSEVLLDAEGKAAVTLDFVCQRCHESASLEELSKFAQDFHEPEKAMEHVGLNTGLTGTWWNADRAGEGFLLEVTNTYGFPLVFLSLYTYDDQGNQVYLVAVSSETDGATAQLNVSITTAQKWGSGFNPEIENEFPWGSGTITFSSCGVATVLLQPNEDALAAGFTEFTFELTRTFDNVTCPAFDNHSGISMN